ncbi:sensor domain-containing diguanylate cyclase [Methylohalobius crimeensis]|uniref:sensor domain-containing diguanylate cyclase n=1 Tax=Methylohalobius crimeensis TaxID=244365 RepID=UPI0003FE8082|nr:diguanylate cyclase [Methylohalobius crimeensis]
MTGAFGGVVLVGFSILIVLHLISDRRIVLGDAEEEAKMAAQYVAHDIERRLHGIEQMFFGIDDLLDILPHAAPFDPTVRAVLQSRRQRDAGFMDLLVVDPRGAIVHWTGPGNPPSVLDRSYVTAHLDNRAGDWFIGPPQLSKVHDGEWFFAVSRAFRHPDGSLKRILVAILDLGYLQVNYSLDSEKSRVGLASKQGERYLPVGRVNASPIQACGLQGFRGESALTPWYREAVWIGGVWLAATLCLLWMLRCLSRQQERLNHLATTDSLSGLNNRGHFMTWAEESLQQARRYDQPFTVLVLDIDNFKRVNDDHGHACGDAAIRAVADILRQICRKTDLLGRLGGEEFGVVLTQTALPGARATARKVLKEVAAKPIGECGTISITASIGVSSRLPGDASLECLLWRADQALYNAKRRGKNRVEILTETLPNT